MKIIELTQGYEAYIDDADYDWLNQYNWCVWIPSSKPYAASAMRKGRKLYKMHRIILKVDDPKIRVDHKDGNGLNNQRDNIRLATNQQNNRNAPKDSSLGYRGVQQTPTGRYQVQIRLHKGQSKYLGTYDDPIEAAKIYDSAAKEVHGEFAVLNFP